MRMRIRGRSEKERGEKEKASGVRVDKVEKVVKVEKVGAI